MIKIAIFASGTGSNAKKIIEFFGGSKMVKVQLVVSNKSSAGALQIAKDHNIETLVIEKERFYKEDHYLDILKSTNIHFIILAGFLLKIPVALINAFPQKIINIHPALLPTYGGKNMYGNNVHEAVINSDDTESGITIHYVDEHYDHGDVIFQARCPVMQGETVSSLAEKIHVLEHEHFPRVIKSVIEQTFDIKVS